MRWCSAVVPHVGPGVQSDTILGHAVSEWYMASGRLSVYACRPKSSIYQGCALWPMMAQHAVRLDQLLDH